MKPPICERYIDLELPTVAEHSQVFPNCLVLGQSMKMRTVWQTAYRKQLCINGPIERSQHLITRAAREAETSESFGQIESEIGGRVAAWRVALLGEAESSRIGSNGNIAKPNEETNKGRRHVTSAFVITLRSSSFATGKTSCGDRI